MLAAARSPPPPPQQEPPPPSWESWTSSDPRCVVGNFPVLFNESAVAALKAAQNGTVTHNQWLEQMEFFFQGLEALRTVDVPLECVPPPYRQAAVEDVMNGTATGGTPAGRRKLAQVLSGQEPLTTLLGHDALLAAQAAAAQRMVELRSLFLNLRITEFGTAILETVLFEQIQARSRICATLLRCMRSHRCAYRVWQEDINIQNAFQSFFSPLAIQKVARLQFDLIAGKEALFRLLASPPPPKARASAPGPAPSEQSTSTPGGSALPLGG